MSGLQGKIAIVTGGSRGIGRAIAERLARDGATVVVNYVRAAADAERVVAAIAAAGGTALAVQADLSRADAAARLFDAAAHLGTPAILVANAGVYDKVPILATTEEIYDRQFAMTKGTFFLLQEAARRLADGGRIVTVSSGASQGFAQNSPAYGGAKAAIEVFTRALSKELGPRGITANSVLPGVVETDMNATWPAEVKEATRRGTSLGRLGLPNDIADVVAFLVSDDARWITGQRLPVNGGSA